ncbi:MAG: pyridoxamine 5'-phosphate oxidase family protein [Paludibacteraceae bacterium]
MKIDNSNVRRQDRLLVEEKITEILKEGEYGYLSVSTGNQPYGIPISFAWNGADSIYFHSAPDGRKIAIINDNHLASFCIVAHTKVIPEKFTTEYESIILRGEINIVTDKEECLKALEMIVDKYAANYKQEGMKYAEKALQRTSILRFDCSDISGKAKYT